MLTTIYLIRHSKSLKVNNDFNSDTLQLCNEKQILCEEGEQLAKQKFNDNEFKNIDVLFSSNYVRSILTAKYISDVNKINININSAFGERKFGVMSYSELPNDFEIQQFNDENYKIDNGESQKEVRERMIDGLIKILNNYKGKRIAIVTHSTAIMFLLKKWCDITYNNNYLFKDKVFFNGKWNYCEVFKLVFDENNDLISIVNL